MIPPPINAHIGHGRHVAGYALRASTAGRMPMMFRHIKACRQVALRANRIAFCAQRAAMRVVTIGADHAGALHAALREGSPLKYFALNLAIGVIFALLEQHGCMGVQKALAWQRVRDQRARSGMARRAAFHLSRGGLPRRPIPTRDATRIILGEAPGATGSIAKPC